MVCPYCHSPTQVSNSRKQSRTYGVWRRRNCTTCNAVFTSEEFYNFESIWRVRDSSGKLTSFSRDKLFLSILASLSHRPDNVESATSLTATAIKSLIDLKSVVLKKEDIKNSVHSILKRFDAFSAEYYRNY